MAKRRRRVPVVPNSDQTKLNLSGYPYPTVKDFNYSTDKSYDTTTPAHPSFFAPGDVSAFYGGPRGPGWETPPGGTPGTPGFHINGGGGGGGGGGQNPPNHITIPGFTPDYQSLIEHDPYFAQVRDLLSAQSVSDAAQRDAQLGQAFINFGETPSGYGDSNVSQAASNNPYSTLAQLQLAHQNNLRNNANQLAARGILQSGEYGYQLGNENHDYLQNQYEARQQLLDFINGVQSAFAQAEQNRQQQLLSAGQQAYQNQLALPQNQPTSPSRGNLVSQYAHGAYYKGQDGKLYNAQGQAINAQNEIANIRNIIQHWRGQGKNWNWIRNTRAWDSLQYLLGSQK